jgi:DNA-binding NarL/FixJ family response regulator
MRVLIADTHAPVRSALRRLLQEEYGVEIAGEAANIGDLMRMALATQPDCILLDWDLSLPAAAYPAQNAALQLRREKLRNVILASLLQIHSCPRILILSCLPEAERLALGAGAHAFVLKSDPPDRLQAALRALLSAG